ncbi:MAG TPA: FHA domain-containing protein [Polyangiaceae bacterium]|jgi:pSer/pThr/pTyr-binding forkhead associated (FHA) protein
MWKLVIEDDESKRTSVPLTRDDYTIGRKEGNTIRLTERNVSREHAKIHKNQNGAHTPDSPFLLEDMNSYNGVYVNGLRVAQPQKLQHGDLIQIGDYRIILQDEALTEDAAMQSATTQDMKSTVPTGVVSRASLLLERPNRLVMLAGPTPGAEFPLDKDRTTIGRAEDSTISVNHNSVSRLHCEVHSLGEGRYEVVDKGSSNGVRVNGSDLRRSIVEPGDIIELGDVRFRFVGAGQIFLPGVGDSQQLEAIPDRPPTALRQTPGATSLVPFVIVGALVAVAVVVGVAVYQHQQGPAPVADTSSHPNEDPEQISLRAAKKLCDEGKCDVAHDKLILDIGKGSLLKQSSDYQMIETRWADDLLVRADKEPDPMKKRSLLRLVTDDDGVPLTRRNVANAKLAELDAAASVTSTASNSAPPPTTATAPTHSATVPGPTGTVVVPVPTHTATATHPHNGSNVLQQASALSLAGDNAGARALLEPHVFGGHGAPEEVRMLKGICKAQHDKECVAAIEKKYP